MGGGAGSSGVAELWGTQGVWTRTGAGAGSGPGGIAGRCTVLRCLINAPRFLHHLPHSCGKTHKYSDSGAAATTHRPSPLQKREQLLCPEPRPASVSLLVRCHPAINPVLSSHPITSPVTITTITTTTRCEYKSCTQPLHVLFYTTTPSPPSLYQQCLISSLHQHSLKYQHYKY
ncbi:hypothetical protein Pcinc_027529 [Petrolisthes cinctipes]|uniref:Uncharacterized protein n=1 Tax=Petrolisthes cinctipes TaxID=88211 RepID=A0AAE1F558_PETCI|nr:hypothetical protein Pcinc_027529 [Petrolisthes cinctipes]